MWSFAACSKSHVSLTGNYDWNTAQMTGRLRPLRAIPAACTLRAA